MNDPAQFSPEAKAVFDMSPRQRAAELAAASVNEQITRRRVEALEGLLARNLRGRLTWLLLGR